MENSTTQPGGRKRNSKSINDADYLEHPSAPKRARYSHAVVTTGGDMGPMADLARRPLVTTLGYAGRTRVALCGGTQQYKVRRCDGVTLKDGVDSHSPTLPMRRNHLISAACLEMNVDGAAEMRHIYSKLNICEAPISLNARKMWEFSFARHTLAYLSRLHDGAILPCILHVQPVLRDPTEKLPGRLMDWKKSESWARYAPHFRFKPIFDDLDVADDDAVKHVSGPLPAPFKIRDESEMFETMRDMKKTTYALYVQIGSPHIGGVGHAVLLIFRRKRNGRSIKVSYIDPTMESKHDSFFAYMAHQLCRGFAGGSWNGVYYAGPTASYRPVLKVLAKGNNASDKPMFARGFQAANGAAPSDARLDPVGFCTVWCLLIAEHLVNQSGGGRYVIDPPFILEQFARRIGPDPARWRKLALDYMFSRAVDIHAWATKFAPRYSDANAFRRVMIRPYVERVNFYEVLNRVRQYHMGGFNEFDVGRGFSYMR